MPFVPAPHKNAPMPVASPKLTVVTGHSRVLRVSYTARQGFMSAPGTLKYMEIGFRGSSKRMKRRSLRGASVARLGPNGLDIEKETTHVIVRWTRVV